MALEIYLKGLWEHLSKNLLVFMAQGDWIAKKSNKDEESTHINGELIKDVFNNKDVLKEDIQLIAGTAWLFSDANLDSQLDYLFIDEAGQVAIARTVAVGTSAKNIILLGIMNR